MKEIIVLMSTYNGEKYLKEQIDSILAQKDVDLTLFIRDDGSKDTTCDILKDYVDAGSIVWMNEGEHKNLGLKNSFLSLLKEAYSRWPDVSYFSFSDQDDVWLENKLRRALDAVCGKGNERGVLYHSNRFYTDEDLNIYEKEELTFYDDFAETLWKNNLTACTMVFDRTFAEYIIRINPVVTEYHDAWAFRLAKSIGTEIIFDPEATMLYRQHGDNACGVDSMDQSRKLSVREMFIRAFSFKDPGRHFTKRALREIYENYSAVLSPEAKEWMELVQNYDKSFRTKWKLLTKAEIRKRPLKLRIRLYEKIIVNRL